MRIILCSLSLLALPIVARAVEPPDEKALDALVRDALKSWKAPGVAVAIVREGKVIYLKGFGVREIGKDDPLTPDTLFPLASCSKAFTTTALAMLVDEGKLDWDDRVRKHVSFFHLSDPLADREVTLRDLLCHRTGLAGHELLWYHAPWSAEEAVRRAGLLPLDKPFRSAFQYQSTMYTAAGLAVASASKMPWEQFIKKRIFEPLDMRGAVCSCAEAAKVVDRAHGHRIGTDARAEVAPFYVHSYPDAAGTIHATARDLTKWLRFQLDDGIVGDRRLVSAGALGETHIPQMTLHLQGAEREIHVFTTQFSYAMAWATYDYRGHRIVAHAGAIDGFRAQLTMAPREKLGIVLLTNLHKTQMNMALTNTLLDRLLNVPRLQRKDWNAHIHAVVEKERERFLSREREQLAKRRPGTRPSLERGAYVGAYEHPAFGRVQIREERGSLIWEWNSFHAPLEHFHYDTYRLPLDLLGTPFVSFHLTSGATVDGMRVEGPLGVEFRKVTKKRE
jgi:CubicO group peptidase (beta-lactamase class C family)